MEWDIIFRKLFPEILTILLPAPTPSTPNTLRTNFWLITLVRKRSDKRTKTCGFCPMSRFVPMFTLSQASTLLSLRVPALGHSLRDLDASLPARESILCFSFYSNAVAVALFGVHPTPTRSLLLSSWQLLTIIKQSLRISWMMSSLLGLFGYFWYMFSAWSKTDPWAVSSLVIYSLTHLISLIFSPPDFKRWTSSVQTLLRTDLV